MIDLLILSLIFICYIINILNKNKNSIIDRPLPDYLKKEERDRFSKIIKDAQDAIERHTTG